MLAVFVGFEVIAKVSSTLHTPLMSGTNAIHGVIMVGAIVVTRQCALLAGQGDRLSSPDPRDGECRRRIRGHRPDARNVQGARRRKVEGLQARWREVSLETGIHVVYLVAAICFILALRGLIRTTPRPLGNASARSGWCSRSR